MHSEHPNSGLYGRVPLFIGVTGHRDLIDGERESISSRVRHFFGQVSKRYPKTPLRVYSGMAPGADQLVAEIARELGIPVVPVFPMPANLYRGDFANDAAAARIFESFVGSTDLVELPLLPGCTAAEIFADEGRDAAKAQEQYAQLSDFLAVRCQIILALWDGRESDRLGGTAWTIKVKTTGRLRSAGHSLNELEPGLVYHVPVGRKAAIAASPSGNGDYIMTAAKQPILDGLDEIEYFNGLVARAPMIGGPEYGASFDAADTIALDHQIKLQRARVGLTSCVTALMLMYAVYSEFVRSLWLIEVYILTLAGGAAAWLWQRRQRVEMHFLDYRALAEALRVQEAWSASGVHRPVANYYLRKQTAHLGWIRFALLGFASDTAVKSWLDDNRRGLVSAQSGHRIFRDGWAPWVEGQERYFRKAAAQRTRVARRVGRASQALYGIGLGAAVGTCCGHFIDIPAGLEHGLVFGMGVFPALAGILLAWLKQSACEEEARQSARMARLYATAHKELEDVGLNTEMSLELAESRRFLLLQELGIEALQENADWLLTHRDHPLEVPLSAG